MSKYYIENMGCDDSTSLKIELTDKELDIFIKICKELNKKSKYQCQPRIAVYKYEECYIEVNDDEAYITTYNAKNLTKED